MKVLDERISGLATHFIFLGLLVFMVRVGHNECAVEVQKTGAFLGENVFFFQNVRRKSSISEFSKLGFKQLFCNIF